MPSRTPILRHRLGGGWAPDFGPVADVDISGGMVRVPWLVDIENMTFTLDGGARKIGGTEKVNAAALESGVKVMGLFDYWRHGTSGSPAQKRVIHVGTKIKKDDADGNFTDIFTGLTAGAIPSYAVFDDYLIMMNTTEVPKFWDQTTAKDLGTNTPNGAFGVTHKNRFWIAGVDATPSRLFYSQALPSGADGDWNGTGAGIIDVDPGDGDRITGLASYKDELWVFKGPYKGSIHRIGGSSPADFSRRVFVRGLGAVGHNSIFPYSDDLGFMWVDGSVHSLKATAAFGDFREAALSLPLNEWLRDHARTDRLGRAWAANSTSLGKVFITIAIDTSSDNNFTLCMDYRFIQTEGQPRWSAIPMLQAACVANVSDETASEQPAIYAGGNDGFVRRVNRTRRTLDATTGYSAHMTWPFLHYGEPVRTKTLGHVAVGIVPRGAEDFVLRWTRDGEAEQTQTISQAGSGFYLAPAAPLPEFMLDESFLAGEAFLNRFVNLEEGGEFRTIQFGFTQGGADGDLQWHEFSAAISPGANSWEN